MENAKLPEVRKRVWNYKIETLDKMKALRDTLDISMPEVIDLAIENLMIETGLYATHPELENRNDGKHSAIFDVLDSLESALSTTETDEKISRVNDEPLELFNPDFQGKGNSSVEVPVRFLKDM